MPDTPKPIEPPKVIHKTWALDPWLERSEEFYQNAYKGGFCKFCGVSVPSALFVCECPGLVMARAEFKRKIGSAPERPQSKHIDYDPDAYLGERDTDTQGIF